MKKYELAICIPTYNRSKYIDQLIKSISDQISDETSQYVQICISDNASTDDTLKVIEKWEKNKNIHIVFNRNKHNIGPDRNYLKAVSISNSKYCWLMGSDDVIGPNSIKYLLNIIKDNKYDILICDRLECDINLNPINIRSFFIKKNLYWDTSTNDVLSKYFENVNSLGGVFSYISSIVFKKDKWIIDDNVENFIGTAYVHVYILLKALVNGCSLKHIDIPLVLCRLGNDSFASQGIINRILLDFEGYFRIADIIFKEKYEIKKLFLKILKREHPFKRIIIIQKFNAIKYFEEYLINVGWNKYQIKLAFYLKHLYNLKPIYAIYYRFKQFISYYFKRYFNKIILKETN